MDRKEEKEGGRSAAPEGRRKDANLK